jgi:DNA-binding CsgD family transcriptional regulator
MDLSDASYDLIVHLLYDAVARPAGWITFFTTLGQAVDADSVHMLALDKQLGTLSYSDGYNLPIDGELNYIQKYGNIDPRFAKIISYQAGCWLHCHEVFDQAFVDKDPFYQEFLIPLGKRYVSGCKLLDNPTALIVFSVLRDVGHEPLGLAEKNFLERLTPHMARAAEMQIQAFVFSTKALVGHALVNKLRQPVFLLTTGGDSVLINEAGKLLLETTSLVRIDSGKLLLPMTYQQRFESECLRLEALTRGQTDELSGLGGYQRIAISAKSQPGLVPETLYVFFTLLNPPQVSGAFGLRPLIMLLCYHPRSATPIDAGLLAAAFSLTPAETRISRLLGEGYSLKAIASQLGVQHETVRKQLQAIYRKTSTNRQAELMRLMLHLPSNAFG